jgi:dihydroorotate dehydrogenase
MASLYQTLIRPILFNFDPEFAHALSIRSLKVGEALRIPSSMLAMACKPKASKPVKVWDLEFPNPVGLAAGMDKDAEAIHPMFCMGFGHVEVGTVTPKPQPGNPKPRLFRYPETHAVVNRMGFNNAGVLELKNRVAAFRKAHPQHPGVVGINIGKQKETHIEEASADYLACFEAVADDADYIAANISSPNTQNLRQLQGGDHLGELLKTLNRANDKRVDQGKRRVPTLLKIAPDLTEGEIESIVGQVVDHEWNGIIATNTTIDRTGKNVAYEFPGGLSGHPVLERSNEVLKKVSAFASGKLTLVGVGGIETADHVQQKLDAGANLVQIYSGFIYQGPRMVKRILDGLGNG